MVSPILQLEPLGYDTADSPQPPPPHCYSGGRGCGFITTHRPTTTPTDLEAAAATAAIVASRQNHHRGAYPEMIERPLGQWRTQQQQEQWRRRRRRQEQVLAAVHLPRFPQVASVDGVVLPPAAGGHYRSAVDFGHRRQQQPVTAAATSASGLWWERRGERELQEGGGGETAAAAFNGGGRRRPPWSWDHRQRQPYDGRASVDQVVPDMYAFVVRGGGNGKV